MEDRRRKNISSFSGMLNLKSLIALSGVHTIFPFYHVVSERSLPHINHLYHYRDESEFEQDLDSMLKFFEPISMNQYLSSENNSNGRRQMVLTFDDGLAECHQIIAPLLKKKGVPAVFFLNNQFIDNNYLFYRYKASLLIDRILSDSNAMNAAAEFMAIPDEQVISAIHLINYRQEPLLDAIAPLITVDFSAYLEENPVYMTSDQISDLVSWGFSLGGHSANHVDFVDLTADEIVRQVMVSVQDVRTRFSPEADYFAFPFTSNGVPEEVIDLLLNEHVVEAVFGTAGLKKTGKKGFIQRIPMEELDLPSEKLLKAEFLYYILKKPIGRNVLRY